MTAGSCLPAEQDSSKPQMQQLIEAKSIKFSMNVSVYVVKAKQLHSTRGLVES